MTMTKMEFSPYREQDCVWPQAGRHILAQYDDETILVYQAYRPGIGRWAVEHGKLGGPEFSYARMSWVKPNFLWMMFRSGWGAKQDQEVTLGLRIRRAFFDELLAQAVESKFSPERFADEGEWQRAVARSAVRLQWDPDHRPSGAKLERRAIQLGLRGAALEAFGRAELLEVIDLSDFVAEQRAVLASRGLDGLITPTERVYLPADAAVRAALGIEEQRRPAAGERMDPSEITSTLSSRQDAPAARPTKIDDRPLAHAAREELALERFSLEISAEEYAARNAHLMASFSFDDYRYRDGRLDAWIARLGDILFHRDGAPTIRELRERFLSPEEILAVERSENEF